MVLFEVRGAFMKKLNMILAFFVLIWPVACHHAHKVTEPAKVAEPAPGDSLSASRSNGRPKKSGLYQEGQAPDPSFSLQFVHEQVLEPGLRFNNMPVGGLSALTYDSKNKMFLALSDDKGNKGFPPRFYQFRLSKKKDRYHLNLINHVILKDKNGQPFLPIDPEGMALLNQTGSEETILISSEGAQLPILKAPPQVFVFNTKGQWWSSFPVWDMYWRPRQIGKWGVKENKAFEALSLDPKQVYMYLATESSLHQDDISHHRTGFQNRQFIRITRWAIQNKGLRLKKMGPHKHPKSKKHSIKYQQYAYVMDLFIEKDDMKGANGLTDFVSLGNKKLITVERAYLKKRGLLKDKKMDANWARLFLTDCSQASDVFRKKSLSKGDFVTCSKTLIGDLSSLAKTKIDNIEGIAFGPKVSNETHLLVLVSDNNFNSKQKNQFLFFHYSNKR